MSRRAIQHRIAKGRLHPVMRGVYVVGRPELSRRGHWMAAVLACGSDAVLSHGSAAALWGIFEPRGRIEITVRTSFAHRRPGIHVYRRPNMRAEDLRFRDAIPLTCPVLTLINLAVRLDRDRLERAVNEADRLNLIDPETLRASLDAYRGFPGVARLRALLDRRTFRLTRSRLERRFLPLAAAAGLPVPLTLQWVNRFEVDFFWPDLGLVVETDGLRHHRTPAQQARDRLRDQTHTVAGLTHLRFTHAQVWFEAAYVQETLRAVTARLRSSS